MTLDRIVTELVSDVGGSDGRIGYLPHAVIRAAQDTVDTSDPGSEDRVGLGHALGRYVHDVDRATAR